ncbi:MAG TPA: antibiotic biosynthesis monooxygenase [Chloroflexota bacterium]|nr:antibiotic biosynthesis monooxygenase [Chloroflexota bacterium]
MWAQLIKAQIKPGKAHELDELYREVDSRMSRDSGWVRSLSLRNSKNGQELYAVVVFDSQEKARAYEQSPEQAELTSRLGDLMDGPPEFVDFDEVTEYAP